MFVARSTPAPLLALLLLSAPLAAAQTPEADEAAALRRAEARKGLETKAYALLEEVAAEAQALRLAENRIRVQLTAAGLFWGQDRERARALFRAAIDDLASLISAVEYGDPQFHSRMQSLLQLRHEIVNAMAPHDARLALEAVRATRQAGPVMYGGGPRPFDHELALEMTLAGQVAAQDPKQAVELVEQGLTRGLSMGLLNVLNQLNEQQPDAASRLAGEAIRRLRAESLAGDHEAANTAVNLLQMTRARAAAKNVAPTVSKGGIVIDEALRRQLVETLVAAATGTDAHQVGNAHYLFTTLQRIMPEVERFAPTRLAALRRRAAEFERQLDPHGRAWREHEEVLQTGTIEQILEAAAKVPPEARGQFYAQAASKAVAQGEVERARQIINDHVSDPQQRAMALRDLDRQLPWRAAERGEFEEARRLLARVNTVEERVAMLLQLASMARGRGDAKAARQFVEEARGGLGPRAQNQAQFAAGLQVARLLAGIDAAEGFELVERSVEQLDELLSAAAVLDGFGHESFQEGELKPADGYIWGELVRECAGALAALAPLDFERARTAAQRFRRAEVRTLARLMIAQGVLNDRPTMHGRPGLPPVYTGVGRHP